MGNGNWSQATYQAQTVRSVQAGTNFAWSGSIASGAVAAGVHDDLSPQWLAGPTSPLAGQRVREARDNADHPNSLPIAVFFDETGSMGSVPRLLQTKGYAEDPQLCFGAYGDAKNYEKAPLQVGQFEADNRGDEQLDKIYLEGNGGGNGGESVALAWYFLAFHTATDSWEKRQHKGYAFTVGDEISHDVTRAEVIKYIYGGNADVTLPFEGNKITAAEIVAKVQEKWNLYHLIIDNYSAQGQGSVKFYERLLGKNAIVLEDPAGVAETIALIIGVAEDAIDLDEGLQDLQEIGSNSIGAVGKALAKVGANSGGGGAVVVSNAPKDLTLVDDDELTRL